MEGRQQDALAEIERVRTDATRSVPVARPGLRSTRRQLSLHEFGPDAKELAERPALSHILEEAQPAELKCVGVLKSNLISCNHIDAYGDRP